MINSKISNEIVRSTVLAPAQNTKNWPDLMAGDDLELSQSPSQALKERVQEQINFNRSVVAYKKYKPEKFWEKDGSEEEKDEQMLKDCNRDILNHVKEQERQVL